jgi:xanthine dehydrogenase accessory factor
MGGDPGGEGGGGDRVNADVLALAADLSRRGRPFVLATVVWRRAPSSGKEGSTALITPDRRVRGWLGGACAEPTVIREALRALEEGTPRLLFLGGEEELLLEPGVARASSPCRSPARAREPWRSTWNPSCRSRTWS